MQGRGGGRLLSRRQDVLSPRAVLQYHTSPRWNSRLVFLYAGVELLNYRLARVPEAE